jgi:hypothetical protein
VSNFFFIPALDFYLSQHVQELGNWELAVAIIEQIALDDHGDLESLVPKSWNRDINIQNVACLQLLLAIRNAMASSAWSNVEVRLKRTRQYFCDCSLFPGSSKFCRCRIRSHKSLSTQCEGHVQRRTWGHLFRNIGFMAGASGNTSQETTKIGW